MCMQALVEMAEPIEMPHQKTIIVSPVDVVISFGRKDWLLPLSFIFKKRCWSMTKVVENLTYHPATSFTVEVK